MVSFLGRIDLQIIYIKRRLHWEDDTPTWVGIDYVPLSGINVWVEGGGATVVAEGVGLGAMGVFVVVGGDVMLEEGVCVGVGGEVEVNVGGRVVDGVGVEVTVGVAVWDGVHVRKGVPVSVGVEDGTWIV